MPQTELHLQLADRLRLESPELLTFESFLQFQKNARVSSWNELAELLAATMQGATWLARFRSPHTEVRAHGDAIAHLLAPLTTFEMLEYDAQRVDFRLDLPESITEAERLAIVQWCCVELSLSTFPAHASRSAVGYKEHGSNFVFRVVPPPRVPRFLALLGGFGRSLNAEVQRRHQFLIETSERSEDASKIAVREENRLERLLDTLEQGYVLADANGRLTCSSRFVELTGMRPATMSELSADWCDRAPVEQIHHCQTVLLAIAAGKRGVFELGLEGEKARTFQVAVYDDRDGWIATFEDVSQEYTARLAASVRRDTLRAVLEAAPYAVSVHRDDELLFSNDRFRTELKSIRDCVSSQVVPQSPYQSALPSLHVEVRDDAGTIRTYEHSSNIIEWEGKGAFLTIFREVTEEQAFLARSFELDRVVALGTLADGVAHEINNPLAYVQSNLEYARRAAASIKDPVSDEIREILEEALDGAARVSRLVADFRSVAPAGAVEEVEAVDLHEVISAATNLANATVRARATISTSVEIGGSVNASSARLAQVFINLLVNAAQAMPTTRRGQIFVRAFSEVPGMARIEVRDNGTGIAPEQLETVFKPFFTTKPAGEGTGLGLSICRNIIEGFGGTLKLESQLGIGTTAIIELPMSDRIAEPKLELMTDMSEARQLGARVLVIDDDPQITRVISRVLDDLCVVRTTNDPEEGLTLATSIPFDLVITDLIMPGLNGTQLISALLEAWPDYEDRVLIITGGRANLAALPSDLPLLQKPFGMKELRARVRKTLMVEEVA